MSYTEEYIKKILSAFPDFGSYNGFSPIDAGHINDTFVIEFVDVNNKCTKYLLQKINTNVFKNPDELMQNVIGVTEFLKEKIKTNGGDTQRETLTVFKTKDGKNYYTSEDGGTWRIYNFIDDTYSLNEINNPSEFRDAAYSFGTFQKMLADYPIDTLFDTIPNFHNTASRFNDFKTAVSENISGRKDEVSDEIRFVLDRADDCKVLVNLIENNKIPVRVTHNDTKINNILFDKNTKKGICIVDLDTVMPGLSLYDFGDSIRSGATTAAEDEKDIEKVKIDLELYKAYVDGYLKAAGSSLTENEIKYLTFSAKLLTLECGMRFLSDYLNGDTYFKTNYPEHNLVRTRTQFKLVKEIEEHFDEMEKIVAEAMKNI